MGIGLLQRLYQPYFGMTIFCGTWNPRRYKDNGISQLVVEHYSYIIEFAGSFPDIVFPFNFVHLSKAEMADGAFSYYCLTKVAELRLQNTTGWLN